MEDDGCLAFFFLSGVQLERKYREYIMMCDANAIHKDIKMINQPSLSLCEFPV